MEFSAFGKYLFAFIFLHINESALDKSAFDKGVLHVFSYFIALGVHVLQTQVLSLDATRSADMLY
jgi:hypothetical protein